MTSYGGNQNGYTPSGYGQNGQYNTHPFNQVPSPDLPPGLTYGSNSPIAPLKDPYTQHTRQQSQEGEYSPALSGATLGGMNHNGSGYPPSPQSNAQPYHPSRIIRTSTEPSPDSEFDGYDWWIPAEGINRAVLNREIQRFLGTNAVAKPAKGSGNDMGIPGYKIKADRNFTTIMIDDLKQLSKKYEEKQKREGGRRDDARREREEAQRSDRTRREYEDENRDDRTRREVRRRYDDERRPRDEYERDDERFSDPRLQNSDPRFMDPNVVSPHPGQYGVYPQDPTQFPQGNQYFNGAPQVPQYGPGYAQNSNYPNYPPGSVPPQYPNQPYPGGYPPSGPPNSQGIYSPTGQHPGQPPHPQGGYPPPGYSGQWMSQDHY